MTLTAFVMHTNSLTHSSPSPLMAYDGDKFCMVLAHVSTRGVEEKEKKSCCSPNRNEHARSMMGNQIRQLNWRSMQRFFASVCVKSSHRKSCQNYISYQTVTAILSRTSFKLEIEGIGVDIFFINDVLMHYSNNKIHH